MELTKEQKDIISTVYDESINKVVINALAGSGKTTTLVELTKEILRKEPTSRVLYVVFNSSMAEEADHKFREHDLKVECRTAHAFALSRLRKLQQVNVINTISYLDYEKVKVNGFCNYVKVQKLLDLYCKSELNIEDFISQINSMNPLELKTTGKFLPTELETAKRLYYYLIENYNYTHSLYLKEFATKLDDICDYDYLLFDEAQDADPWMIQIAEKIICKKKYFVGDTFQSIYQWRGAINAMESIDNAKHFTLSNSFRFGENIANVANEILSYRPSFKGKVNGVGNYKSNNSIPTVLFRTNAYMMEYAYEKLSEDDKSKITFQGLANSKNSDDFVEIYHDFISLVKVLAEERKNNIIIERLKNNFGFIKVSPKIKAVQKVAEKEKISVYDYLSYQVNYDCTLDNELTRYFSFYKNHEYHIVETLVMLRDSSDIQEPQKEYNLITAHRAKGLEWDNVTIAGEGWGFETKEEQNLIYVAVTRAKCNLNIISEEVREFAGLME